MFEVRNKYNLTCRNAGHLCEFRTLAEAKQSAEQLCQLSKRKEHYTVVEVKDIWVTSTLDEVLK